MKKPELRLTLIPAPDDARWRSPEYQQELREFEKSLRDKGFKVSVGIELIEAAGGGGPATYTGAFMLATVVVVQVTRCVIAWLKGRAGRKVRVEIRPDGGLKAEAQTAEEVERVLTKAAQMMSEIIGKKTTAKKLPKASTNRRRKRS